MMESGIIIAKLLGDVVIFPYDLHATRQGEREGKTEI